MVSVFDRSSTGPLAGCIEALTRCKQAALAIPDASFDVDGRSIGAHLRHCLEHATELLDGLETGTIRYDARQRDRALERDRGAFVRAMDDVLLRFDAIEPDRVAQSITVYQEADTSGNATKMTSSIDRELHFVASHTIHHLAVIKLMAVQIGVDIPESRTVAFSTASYKAREATTENRSGTPLAT